MTTTFIPEKLPIDSLDWKKLAKYIGRANLKLALYNGLLQNIPNPSILVTPLTNKEAVLSSKIEGTQVSLTNLLEYEAGKLEENNERRYDIQEVINYRNAIHHAQELFKERPFIHLNLLKDLHKILLDGVRGRDKNVGNFRTSQVYIGPPNSSINDAYFVPPDAKYINDALTNWENYINNDYQESLVQLAFLHAQFEIIHPFLDGNGRLGRILIPLYLLQKNILFKPVFYLSEYFENNQSEYYQKLRNITNIGDWQGWIEFFLNAICEQADNNQRKADSIIKLYDYLKVKYTDTLHSQYSIKILDAIFMKPILTINDIQKQTFIPASTVTNIMRELLENKLIDILFQGRGSKPNIYVLSSLIDIIQ